MAQSRPIEYAPDDTIKNQHYCRTITLNITLGAKALRDLANTYLKRTGLDLKHHVQKNAHCFDLRDAESIQKQNDLNKLDFSKLTILLLDTLDLEDADSLHTDKLRLIRNKLCHSMIAELDNDTLFNESSQHIMRIAESVDKANGGTNYSKAMADSINELKMRKQVPVYHISFRIALCNEKFWQMKCSGKKGDALMIRYGLTKFTKTLAANLNARIFLQMLEKKEVISKELKSDIDLIYSNEKQIEQLVFYVVNEVDDTKVLLLSQCLRQTEKCGQLLASMIEHNDGDGQTTDNLIDEKIIDILRQSLEPSPFESVISSDVHMYVEEKLGSEREYKLIGKLVQKTFGMQEDTNESISGLKWKRGFDISKRFKCSCTKKQKGLEGKHCQDVKPPPVNVVLRSFDTPADGQIYKRGFIKPSNGNILYPSREFRHRSTENIPAAHFISKEVVLFAAACMNGRQNGTIYFGISKDEVIGIPRCECLNNLDDSVQSAMETCFKTNASEAQLCVRPVQYLPVGNSDFVVIEIDVVPHHIYLRENIFPVWFPTKGVQLKQYYIYQRKVTVIEEDEVEKQNERCSKLYAVRRDLENKRKDEIKSQSDKLHDVLTEGHRYVTDAFYPIIVSGKISGSPNEITVRRQLDIEYALTSAVMILDFDYSSRLREHVEETNTSFHAMTTKDLIKVGNIGEFESSSIPWIYCNGHDKSNYHEERVQLPFKNWRTERKSRIENALQDIRDKYQENCKVIFLVYQEHIDNTPDPMLKTALKITELFPRECLVIAENNMLINKWLKAFQEEIDSNDLPVCITELDWDTVSDVMKTSFRLNPDIECELPCRFSTYPVSMTKKEKSYFTDIDILSGKECLHETELMDDVSVADKDARTREDFYRGKTISWWNFYFPNHVGERDLLDGICTDVSKWLSTGRNPVEKVYIHHHPGSGGTTLGKHILWRYSQFSYYPENIDKKLYRCCTLRKFTNDTIDQLVRFREYKDQVDPKPIIILIDIDDVTVAERLCHKLDKASERLSGRLFCLVIIIERVSFENMEPPFLSHVLTGKEKRWFDKTFVELENEYDSEYVDTLIAFNFLKNSFDEKHINTITEKLLKEVKEDETEVLKCLAIISAFGEKRIRVPKRAFDEMFNDQSRTQTWDLRMSTSMTLMLVQHDNSVSLISRSLAKAIVSRFKIYWHIDLSDLVECLFKVLQKHKSQRGTDHATKQFIDIVTGLFKRERRTDTVYNISNDVEDKQEFSDLVQTLAQKKKFQTSTDANQRVKNMLLKCYKLTSDSMVAQQLVRYCIFLQDFAEAESLIENLMSSLNWTTSYLLDTYGNLHKTHLVALVKEASKEGKMVSDKKAAEIINMAFNAIEKFREGQANAVKENPRIGKRNTSCFFNEIKTALHLLDSFKHFKAFKDEGSLLVFLNGPTTEADSSSFAGLLKECPQVRQLRKGDVFQAELEEHIRFLRDNSYQTEFDVVTVQDERLILTLHEHMDRFYSDFENEDKCIFTCPIDLKSLMEALDEPKKEQKVKRRVETAQKCIKEGIMHRYDDRDFVIYLGYTILKYSASQRKCSSEEYEELLDYSKRLIKRQCDKEDAMLFLETFLFFGMLHWPSENRAPGDFDQFCSPKEYKMYIKTWGKQFNKNLKLSTPEQKERNTPKLLFALGKGSPGNDIVNLNIIENTVDRENRDNKEKKRMSRTDDKFWDEELVVQKIERLTGTVEEEGSLIRHEAVYSQGRRKFLNIKLRRKDPSLQNKKVTFCLAFSWKGPVALGVKAEEPEKPTCNKQLGHEPRRKVSDRRRNIPARQPLTNPAVFGPNSPEHATSSSYTDLSGPRYSRKSSSETELRNPISVRDAAESSMHIQEIIRSQPEYVVVCCVGHLDLVVLHVNEDTYLYHLQENKALLKEGHLHHLLWNNDINRVFHDVGSVSPDLIRKYGVVMDGNVWDIQIMSEHVKLDKKERKQLIPYGYTDKIFQTWSEQNDSYSKQLAKIGLNREIGKVLSERGNLIGKMYTMCKGKLKEKVKETGIQKQLKKDIFRRAQPIELKLEIEQLRKEQKVTKMADPQGPTEGRRRFASEQHAQTERESDGRISEILGNNFNGARPKTSQYVSTIPDGSPGGVVSGTLLYSQITARPKVSYSDSSTTPPVCVTAPQSTLEKATSEENSAVQGNSQQRRQTKNKKKKGRKGK